MRRILFLTHSQIGDRTFGGPIRANAIRDALVKLGQVDTLIIHGGPEFTLDEEWDTQRARHAKFSMYGFGYKALIQRRSASRWVGRIISEGQYDAIIVQYLDLATLVPRNLRGDIIYDPDDFTKTATGGGLAALPARGKVALRNAVAVRVAEQARHVWYVNPADRVLPPNGSRSALPNIVGMPPAGRARHDRIPDRLLMVGHLLHGPNVDGLRWFATNVLPKIKAARAGTELHVIGRYADDLPSLFPEVRFHGFVADLSSAYDQASLVIAPIHSGAGTQIKVIDALAHSRPLLASDFAHRGFAEHLQPGMHLLVAESEKDWVEQALWALDHADVVDEMARNGEAVVRAAYGQDHMDQEVKATLERVFSAAVSSRAAGATPEPRPG